MTCKLTLSLAGAADRFGENLCVDCAILTFQMGGLIKSQNSPDPLAKLCILINHDRNLTCDMYNIEMRTTQTTILNVM